MLETVQVAVENATIHFDRLYSYRIPPRLRDKIEPGSMVLVPFGRGNQPRMAVVLDAQPDDAPRLKELLDAAPEEARLTPDLMQLVRFLKEHTFCTWYEAVKAVIPYGAQYRAGKDEAGAPRLQKQLAPTETWYRRTDAPRPAKLTEKQTQALTQLECGPARLVDLPVSRAVLNGLVQKGLIERQKEYKGSELYTEKTSESQKNFSLTAEQEKVCARLLACLGQDTPQMALLHGVTGSGKTIVFLKLIEAALEQHKTALVLVPEISLTPQMITRLKDSFGARVAVQHSALNHTERLAQWQMIQKGGADIVVGTRSAVFAPLQNLGLIVLDEEQEHTYRSESAPRYSAHDVARLRASQNNALLLLASATPSTESYFAAQQGRCALVELTERYGGMPLPQVDLIDMRAEMAQGNAGEISLRLAQELKQNLDAGLQSILLLNRRGYRTVGACTQCGHVLKCGSCSVPMVYHKAKNQLLCHYCGKVISPIPAKCPECGGALRYTGFGTQKVEEELAQLFPQARILRMDQDSTLHKDAHTRMLSDFGAGKYDILLGTQMVAKGLDFEKVTLVGVLGIDSLLFSQGFRAYETVFSLVTQVVGRSGRAALPGRAVIQTIDPEHPVLQLAARQDYKAFYEQEIAFRKLCLYPPYCSICVVSFVGAKEPEVFAAARRFSALLGQQAGQNRNIPLRVLGPTPMNVVMVNDRYRYKLTVKCRNDRAFRELMQQVLELYGQEGLPGKAGVALDMNSDGDL